MATAFTLIAVERLLFGVYRYHEWQKVIKLDMRK